ncbi:hypothetical protein RBSH_01240 [Rhodopirellula baltica SH28]|uniref:Uncharacterized protein n=1 Tax=Rhodopirellula baltica SH28 TaxID=993517 RepID=K5EC44_RHOBT|nr:hypothetical protein RBSH_01240 [Rhodopirellula baltica SH28]
MRNASEGSWDKSGLAIEPDMARTSLIERKAVAQKFEWVSANCKRNVIQ